MNTDSTGITPEQLKASHAPRPARFTHLALAGLALSPFMPANPPAYDNSSSVRQRNARSSGHMLSPKSPRPTRRNAQHNPRRR